MFKRLFFGLLGLGLGVALGVLIVRKVEQAPSAAARAAAGTATDVAQRLGRALDAGREAMASREAELRALYLGADRSPDPEDLPPHAL